jgi:hypothetical protein
LLVRRTIVFIDDALDRLRKISFRLAQRASERFRRGSAR